MKYRRPLAALALAVLLAACRGEAPTEGEATGEVLEGTISDDMLALDQVRSEPPLADPTAADSGDRGGTARAAATAEEEEAEGEAPAPEAED